VEERLHRLVARLEAEGDSLSPELLAALDRQVEAAQSLLEAGEGN
jgi:hypothetical protein